MVAKKTKRWSQHVTEKSDALDLESGVFTHDDPRRIALSLNVPPKGAGGAKAIHFVPHYRC